MVRVRACFECKEYVVVHSNYISQTREENFERDHRMHPIAVVDLNEVRHFSNVNAKYKMQAAKPIVNM
jgi:hypothetical protein